MEYKKLQKQMKKIANALKRPSKIEEIKNE